LVAKTLGKADGIGTLEGVNRGQRLIRTPHLTHNLQCSCNPGFHWETGAGDCQPNLDNPQFYPGPRMPFVPPPGPQAGNGTST